MYQPWTFRVRVNLTELCVYPLDFYLKKPKPRRWGDVASEEDLDFGT